MRVFWCETDPWIVQPSAAVQFCECAGIPTKDFFCLEDLIPHAAGRFLLLEGFRRYAGAGSLPPLYTTPDGKPYFSGGKPAFSLSHAGKIAVCAFSASEIGIDVEKVAPVDRELLSVLRPEERAYLRQIPEKDQAMEFYRLWTQKESLVKASGEGLGGLLGLESVIAPGLGWKTCLNGFRLHRLSFLEPGYSVSASIKGKESIAIARLELPDRFDSLPVFRCYSGTD